MTKTKTKRTIWTVSIILVALLVGAAIFYFFYLNQKSNEEENPIKEVQVKETIKASELGEGGDQKDQEGAIESREFVSEYYNEGEFNAVGGSWEELNAPEDEISIFVRVRNKEIESEWYPFYKERAKSEKGVNYYHAESPVLIRGDSYQYKIIFDNKNGEVRNLEITIINTMGTTSSRLFDKITSLFLNNQAGAASWNPANIISRSEWGGSVVNESATLWPPQYADKSTKFVVHHTAGENKSCPDLEVSKQDMRAIWNYHTYYNKWGDIGYNYVLDHCGRVFEGRLGGNNVIAGHASPYNFWDKNTNDGFIDEVSIGVSVMGDYSNISPTSPIFEGAGRIIGYKSYINNIDPHGISLFKDKTTYDIASHRDYTATACPGTAFYEKLSSVRSAAKAHKDLYISDYGVYIEPSDNVYINAFRVSMDDLNGGLTLASNPAVGEPITIRSALKNTSDQPIELTNIRVRGRYDNGVEFTVGTQSSLSIGGGQVAVLALDSNQFGITSGRSVGFYIDYEFDGRITRPKYFDGFTYPSYTPHFPSVRVSSNPSSSPISPALNQSAQLSFSLRNLSSRPAYLRNSFVSVTQNNVAVEATHKNQPVILPSQVDTYSTSYTFTSTGTYQLTPYFTYGNGARILAQDLNGNSAIGTVSVLSEPIDYSKIIQVTLRVSVGDYSTTDPSDYLYTVRSPAIGEELTIRGALKNENNSAVTISNVRYIGVYDNGVKFVAGSAPTLTLQPGVFTLIPNITYRMTSFRTVYFYIDYQAEGIIRLPYIGPTYSPLKITPHFPNVKVVSSPVFSPSSVAVNSPISGSFKLKNYDDRPAYLRNIELRTCVSGLCWSFPKIVHELAPGEVYQYVQAYTPTRGGTYETKVRFIYGNGSLVVPAAIGGVKNYGYYRVYVEVSSLDGVSMPATSGKVAVEQHLVTNSLTSTQISNIDTAFRSCVTTQNEVYPYPYCANPNNLSAVSPISESNHYSATGVMLSSLKNRMAWMTTAKIRQTAGQTTGWISAGGLYGAWGIAPSTSNEKYYINMRWNYTNLHGQPIYTNKSWYYGKKVIVTNPANGKKVVTAVIEYGPSIMTRVAGLSPEAMYAIEAVTDNTLNYYWAADQSMPLGPIN